MKKNFLKMTFILLSFALLIEVWVLIHDRINTQREFEGVIISKYHDSTQRSPYYIKLDRGSELLSIESDIFRNSDVGDHIIKAKGSCVYKVVKNLQDTLYFDKRIQ